MSRKLEELMSALPINLRMQIDGYLLSVEAAASEVFRQAGKEVTTQTLEAFLLICAIKKLWDIVDSQFWILDNSLTALRDEGVGNIAIGSNRYTKKSAQYMEIRDLRDGLRERLATLEVFQFTSVKNLADVAKLVSQ